MRNPGRGLAPKTAQHCLPRTDDLNDRLMKCGLEPGHWNEVMRCGCTGPDAALAWELRESGRQPVTADVTVSIPFGCATIAANEKAGCTKPGRAARSRTW